jgi:hypothetical protein
MTPCTACPARNGAPGPGDVHTARGIRTRRSTALCGSATILAIVQSLSLQKDENLFILYDMALTRPETGS